MKTINPADKIASGNTSFLNIKFNLQFTEINKNFWNNYWAPKLHKNLTKAQFIINVPKYLVKKLLKAVTAASKLLCNQIENNNFNT